MNSILFNYIFLFSLALLFIYIANRGYFGLTIPNADIIESTVVDNAKSEATEQAQSTVSNNFLPDGISSFDEIIRYLTDSIFKNIFNIFKPVEVTGHFDDLIGQQYIIFVMLFVITISITLLFSIYIFNNILLHNKEYFLNRFNNRFILLYIKYQIFTAKLSLVIFPIIIYIGLFSLFTGLHFLVTHPVPYESLGIDLHSIVGKK